MAMIVCIYCLTHGLDMAWCGPATTTNEVNASLDKL
jgi:hypothetical protein